MEGVSAEATEGDLLAEGVSTTADEGHTTTEGVKNDEHARVTQIPDEEKDSTTEHIPAEGSGEQEAGIDTTGTEGESTTEGSAEHEAGKDTKATDGELTTEGSVENEAGKDEASLFISLKGK